MSSHLNISVYVVLGTKPQAALIRETLYPLSYLLSKRISRERIYRTHKEWLNTESRVPWQMRHGDPTMCCPIMCYLGSLVPGFWQY